MDKIRFDSSKMGTIYDNTGYESEILNYNNDGETLLKAFRKNIVLEQETQNIPFRYNKERKLVMLSKYKSSSLVPLKDLVYNGYSLVGYTMDKIEGTKIRFDDSRRKKLIYLRQIKKTMLELNKNGIYIGDFSPDNFIIDSTGKVINIDLDNYSIMGLDFDIKTDTIRSYQKSKADKDLIDRYCFNMFVLSLLGRYALGYFSIKRINLPLIMYNKHNLEVFREMQELDENYTGKIFTLGKQK